MALFCPPCCGLAPPPFSLSCCPSVCLPVCLSFFRSVCPSVGLSVVMRESCFMIHAHGIPRVCNAFVCFPWAFYHAHVLHAGVCNVSVCSTPSSLVAWPLVSYHPRFFEPSEYVHASCSRFTPSSLHSPLHPTASVVSPVCLAGGECSWVVCLFSFFLDELVRLPF